MMTKQMAQFIAENMKPERMKQLDEDAERKHPSLDAQIRLRDNPQK